METTQFRFKALDPAMYPSGVRDKTFNTGRACACTGEQRDMYWYIEAACPSKCNKGFAEKFRLFHFRKHCQTCNGVGYLYSCRCGADLWSSKSYASCAIATATMGDPSHEYLDLLRGFRTRLKRNPLGLLLVGYYALIKKPLAEYVGSREKLKIFMRLAFIEPAVGRQRTKRSGFFGWADDAITFVIFLSALWFVTLLYPAAIIHRGRRKPAPVSFSNSERKAPQSLFPLVKFPKVVAEGLVRESST